MDELDNTDAQVGDGAIYIVGRNTVIENNIIEYGSISGVTVAGWQDRGDNTRIEGNEIRYFDSVGIHASPIRAGGDNIRILKNTISDTGRDGMFVVGLNGEVAYNDVSNTGLINNDGGIFYTVGNDEQKNTEIHHNWFHDSFGRDYYDGRIAGIYLDNDSKGYLVHHNVVWNIPWSAVQLNWDNWNNNIYHNTFINAGGAMGEWINGRNPRDNRVWNNYSDRTDWIRSSGYDLDSNVIDVNVVQLVDSANQNFFPNESSSLLDQARTIDDFSKPFVGPAPDIGAYEVGGTAWTAGVNAIEDTCGACQSDPDSAPVHPPVTPSPIVTATPAPISTSAPAKKSSGGGGSTGFGLIVLLGVLVGRRMLNIRRK